MEQSLIIVEQWNLMPHLPKVFLNIPEVWMCSGALLEGQMCLFVEPWIHNWQKFNCKSGWASNDNDVQLMMQGLSHFSYHCSGGQLLLCDLQGGVYADGVVLTDDPVVISLQLWVTLVLPT